MKVRTWRGYTKTSDADAYFEYLKISGIEEYQKIPGNKGLNVIRRDSDGKTEFLLISFWDSIESIRSFAGTNIDKAIFYEEDEKYLIEFDKHVTHYDLLYSSLDI